MSEINLLSPMTFHRRSLFSTVRDLFLSCPSTDWRPHRHSSSPISFLSSFPLISLFLSHSFTQSAGRQSNREECHLVYSEETKKGRVCLSILSLDFSPPSHHHLTSHPLEKREISGPAMKQKGILKKVRSVWMRVECTNEENDVWNRWWWMHWTQTNRWPTLFMDDCNMNVPAACRSKNVTRIK